MLALPTRALFVWAVLVLLEDVAEVELFELAPFSLLVIVAPDPLLLIIAAGLPDARLLLPVEVLVPVLTAFPVFIIVSPTFPPEILFVSCVTFVGVELLVVGVGLLGIC